nr:MAG TPA: hypothetical protein [Caudoviricetes sp.]
MVYRIILQQNSSINCSIFTQIRKSKINKKRQLGYLLHVIKMLFRTDFFKII